jgi:hypothetical protein
VYLACVCVFRLIRWFWLSAPILPIITADNRESTVYESHGKSSSHHDMSRKLLSPNFKTSFCAILFKDVVVSSGSVLGWLIGHSDWRGIQQWVEWGTSSEIIPNISGSPFLGLSVLMFRNCHIQAPVPFPLQLHLCLLCHAGWKSTVHHREDKMRSKLA